MLYSEMMFKMHKKRWWMLLNFSLGWSICPPSLVHVDETGCPRLKHNVRFVRIPKQKANISEVFSPQDYFMFFNGCQAPQKWQFVSFFALLLTTNWIIIMISPRLRSICSSKRMRFEYRLTSVTVYTCLLNNNKSCSYSVGHQGAVKTWQRLANI